jgi:hypothetical protein
VASRREARRHPRARGDGREVVIAAIVVGVLALGRSHAGGASPMPQGVRSARSPARRL